MSKTVLVMAPIQSRSGYGDCALDIVRTIIKKYPDWNLQIMPTLWGGCPITEVIDDSDESKLIRSKFVTGNVTTPPDVFIQVSIPSEARRMGKFCLLFTAGIETSIVDSSWIEGVNRMDLTIVPSKHAKDIFMNTIYDRLDNQQRRVGELRVTKPIEVLFEGIDDKIFKKTNEITPLVKTEMNEVSEKFNFLYVGHWLNGEDGHDRKDVGGLIKSFYEAFANEKEKPGLVLKTSTAGFSLMDKDVLIEKIQNIRAKVAKELKTEDLPNIYLLHGDMSRVDLNALYNHPKIKAMVSFTKGEGFGRPLLEFTVSKKPVLASGWSGQLDFLSNQTAILLPGELKKIHPSAVWDKVILAESSWFYVNYEFAKAKMKDVFMKYGAYEEKARRQYNVTVNDFTLDKMADKMVELFDRYIPKTPETMPLNIPILPKLKRV